MEKILKLMQSHQILNQSKLLKQSRFSFDKIYAQSKSSFNQSHEIYCRHSVPDHKISSIKQESQNINVDVRVTKCKSKSQKFGIYQRLLKLQSEELTQINHKNGQILIVDVWATWCGPCQQPMQHNQDLLQKNSSFWEDKVKIVSVCPRQNIQDAKTKVTQKGWNKIQHLALQSFGFQNQLIKDFNILSIPFMIIVDAQGYVNFTGNPNKLNLNKIINQLLDKYNQVKNKNLESSHQSVINFHELKHIEEQFMKIFQQNFLSKYFEKPYCTFIEVQSEVIIDQGLVEKLSYNLTIKIDQDFVQLAQNFKTIFNDCSANFYTIETYPIKYQIIPQNNNQQCAGCKQKISYPFYWCKWDPSPSSLRCQGCVQKKPEIEGQHYFYKQNSILVLGPWEKVPAKFLGNNIQPQNQKIIERGHSFACNSCGMCPANVGQARYVCPVCSFGSEEQIDCYDLCEKCVYIEVVKAKSPFFKYNPDSQEHNPNHPLLRVLYNLKGYSKF